MIAPEHLTDRALVEACEAEYVKFEAARSYTLEDRSRLDALGHEIRRRGIRIEWKGPRVIDWWFD